MSATQAAFVQQYKAELQDLTFNSKAIINTLTMLANENKAAGGGIAEAITQHIKQSPPHVRLPVLYLMDSIVKNVGLPYTALFASDVPEIYMAVWRASPESRPSLQRLLGTWQKHFPQDILKRIGQYLAEAQTGSTTNHMQSQPGTRPASFPSQQQFHSRPHVDQFQPNYPPAQPIQQVNAGFPNVMPNGLPSMYPAGPNGFSQAPGPSGHIQGPAAGYPSLPPPPSPGQRNNYAAAYTPTYPEPQLAAGQYHHGASPHPGASPHLGPSPQANLRPQGAAAPVALPAFLSQLIDAGIIPPSGASTSAAPMNAVKEEVPLSFANFSKQDLFPTALKRLREGSQANKPVFLDQRLAKKRKQASGVSFSRQWFVKEKDWLAGTTASAEATPAFFDEPAEDTKDESNEEELATVTADPEQPECALSGERFDSVWDDNKNEWRYQGAVALTAEQAAKYGLAEGQLVKVSCLAPTVASGLDSAKETFDLAASQQTAREVEDAAAEETHAQAIPADMKDVKASDSDQKHGTEELLSSPAKRLRTA